MYFSLAVLISHIIIVKFSFVELIRRDYLDAVVEIFHDFLLISVYLVTQTVKYLEDTLERRTQVQALTNFLTFMYFSSLLKRTKLPH